MVQKRDIFLMCLTAFYRPLDLWGLFHTFFFFLFFAWGYSSSGEIQSDWRSLTLCACLIPDTEADCWSDRVKVSVPGCTCNVRITTKSQRWRLPVSDSCCFLLCLFVWERTPWQSAHPEFDSLKKRSTLRLSSTVWSHQSVMFNLMAKCFGWANFSSVIVGS